MELKFPRNVCRYLAPAIRETQAQELTQEIRLSDGMPDVGRILCAWGQMVLRGKEWRSDEISANGGVMVWVLYAPEDGTQPRTMESWLPFTMKWDLHGESREGDIRVRNLLRYVDARSTSARKIMLRAGVASMGEAFVSREQEYSIPGEVPEDVQLLTCSYPVRLYKEAGEKAFLMDEDLTMPDSAPRPEKLVYYTMNPTVNDKKVMGDKVVFRGNGNLHVLYLSEEGQFHSWDFELPFSQLGNLDEAAGTDAQAEVGMCVTSLELELDDESHLRLKCGLLGQYMVDDRQLLDIVADAYSTMRSAEVDMEMLELPTILEQKQQVIPVQQEIHQTAESIVDSSFLPDFPKQQRSWDQRNWQLQGQFKTLYYGEGSALQSATGRWEGEFAMPADENTDVFANVLPVPQSQSVSVGDSIRLTGDMPLMFQTQATQGIPMVTGMELMQPQEQDIQRPSLILRRAGDAGLWDIAKLTGSTVDAIKTANALESEPERDRMLLIPVG